MSNLQTINFEESEEEAVKELVANRCFDEDREQEMGYEHDLSEM